MKTTKKIFAVLFAFVLIFSMAIPAFAAGANTITVKNAVADKVYSLYKMADLTKDGDAYTYTVSADWANFFKQDYVKDYFNVDTNGTLSAVDTLEDDSEAMEKIGKLAIEYAKAGNITAVETTAVTNAEDNTTTATFDNLDDGYYLISSQIGALAIVESTPTNKERVIEEKNDRPGLEKEVEEDSTKEFGKSNDAGIGETVNFKVTISAKPGAENYVMHDKMEKGLAFNADSVEIAGLTQGTDYTVLTADDVSEADEEDEENCTFEIVFTKAYLDTITEETDIVVTYSAVLTADAVDDADGIFLNDAKLTYGTHQTVESTTKTITHSIDLLKYRGEDAAKKALAGAKFQLKDKDKNVLSLVKIDDNNYRLATADDETTVDEFVTNAEGTILIKGLDSDTYYLTETVAPEGYNILKEDTKVIINGPGEDEEGNFVSNALVSVEIANNAGKELPSTGGMGTTIFYVIGGILVVGAAVVLIAKRRMRIDEEA